MVFSDPIIKTGCLAALEKQANSLLKLDPVTLDRLSDHFGSVVEFRCLEPDFQCYATLLEQHVRLSGIYEGKPDVCFSGSVVSFSQLAGDRKAPFSDIQGLTVTGNKALIQALEHIHLDMELDWEKPVVDVLGIVPGHWLAQGIRFAGRQFNHLKETAEQNLSEYVQEELRLIPTRVELEGFQADVENLKDSVARLAEKVEALPTDSNKK